MQKKSDKWLADWRDANGNRIRKAFLSFGEVAETASSIRRAISQAIRSFFADENRRKERGDAHAQLTVAAWRQKPCATARRKP